MAKKFYAVIGGQDGPLVFYDDWSTCSNAIHKRKGVKYKGMNTIEDCAAYLGVEEDYLVFIPPKKVDKRKNVSNTNDTLEKKKVKTMDTNSVYTDGGCSMNGSTNAKAGVGVYYGVDDIRNISMRLPGSKQTNNRAELLAALLGVLGIDRDKKTTLYTDSKYTINSVTKWFPAWLAECNDNDDKWRKSDNWDLIHLLYKALEDRPLVTLEYVPAHTGVPGNEGADKLATLAIKTWV